VTSLLRGRRDRNLAGSTRKDQGEKPGRVGSKKRTGKFNANVVEDTVHIGIRLQEKKFGILKGHQTRNVAGEKKALDT